MAWPEPIEHRIDHLVASVRGEVHVNIGVRLATLIQEPLKDEVVPNRVDARNAEQIRDHRITRTAATLRRNAVAMCAAHNIGAQEKELGEPRALNRCKLVGNAAIQLVTTIRVAARYPRPDLTRQLLVGTHPRGQINASKAHARKVEVQIGPRRNLYRSRNSRRPRRLHRQQLSAGTQMRIGGKKAQRAKVFHGYAVANGGDGVEQLAFTGACTARRGTCQ